MATKSIAAKQQARSKEYHPSVIDALYKREPVPRSKGAREFIRKLTNIARKLPARQYLTLYAFAEKILLDELEERRARRQRARAGVLMDKSATKPTKAKLLRAAA